MREFDSRTQLAMAYQKKINTGDKQKDFDLASVEEICFESIPAISFTHLYGIAVQCKHVTMIHDFGYVQGLLILTPEQAREDY